MDAQIIAAIVVAIGGLLAVLLRYRLTRKKSDAKVKKSKAKEVVLFDSRKGINTYDINTDYLGSRFDIQNGVIIIPGEEYSRYELRTYYIDGKELKFIPKNVLLSGDRKIYVSCEIKAITASFDVAVYLWETPEQDERDPSVDDRSVTVSDNEWRKTDFSFRAPPDRNYTVNINAEKLSNDGSLQIRNLIVIERFS